MALDSLDHVAITVRDIAESVDWYTRKFQCTVNYQDSSWAMLEFANVKLALVVAEQHPPHIGFVSSEAEKFGTLRPHRDGTRSVYVSDPSGNAVEILAPAS